MDDADDNGQEEEEVDELQSEEDVSSLLSTLLDHCFELTWRRMHLKALPQSWPG